MSALGQLLCFLGFHVIDPDELYRRKPRAARIGVNVAQGLPCNCTRCGRIVWR
jgi:hypothetical protein